MSENIAGPPGLAAVARPLHAHLCDHPGCETKPAGHREKSFRQTDGRSAGLVVGPWRDRIGGGRFPSFPHGGRIGRPSNLVAEPDELLATFWPRGQAAGPGHFTHSATSYSLTGR